MQQQDPSQADDSEQVPVFGKNSLAIGEKQIGLIWNIVEDLTFKNIAFI
jgi:hypothetical protein